jgi:hypothetical protein
MIYGGVNVQIHVFLTSSLLRDERITPSPSTALLPGKNNGVHWIGSHVGFITGLNHLQMKEILLLPGLEIRPRGCAILAPSLYKA